MWSVAAMPRASRLDWTRGRTQRVSQSVGQMGREMGGWDQNPRILQLIDSETKPLPPFTGDHNHAHAFLILLFLFSPCVSPSTQAVPLWFSYCFPQSIYSLRDLESL